MSKASYAEKLRDPRWQKKRLKILERDNFACRDCESSEKTLHVHHWLYERGDPWETDDRFLLTVCENCHELRQANEADTRRALAFIFTKCNRDELRTLTTSAVQFVDAEGSTPIFVDELELDWLSDIRWYQEAVRNSGLRKFYERIVGRKPNWKSAAQ